jgi:hypothetical protein
MSAILLTTKKVVPHFWAAISCAFANTVIRIGASRSPQSLALFRVSGPVAIVFVYGKIVSVYEGQLTFANVSAAIARFIESPKAACAAASLVSEMSSPDQFEQLCHSTGKLCIFGVNVSDEAQFESIAKTNVNAPFRFFRCTDACPFPGMTHGFYVFHGRRQTGVVVAAIDDLPATLDRVIDGGAQWVKFADIFGAKAEDTL